MFSWFKKEGDSYTTKTDTATEQKGAFTQLKEAFNARFEERSQEHLQRAVGLGAGASLLGNEASQTAEPRDKKKPGTK